MRAARPGRRGGSRRGGAAWGAQSLGAQGPQGTPEQTDVTGPRAQDRLIYVGKQRGEAEGRACGAGAWGAQWGAAARGCLQQEALGLTMGRGCRKREKRDGQEEAAALSP